MLHLHWAGAGIWSVVPGFERFIDTSDDTEELRQSFELRTVKSERRGARKRRGEANESSSGRVCVARGCDSLAKLCRCCCFLCQKAPKAAPVDARRDALLDGFESESLRTTDILAQYASEKRSSRRRG